jgi:hypothetical protein
MRVVGSLLSKKCKAITKSKTHCKIDVEDFRKNGLCHVHDPDGKFKIQQRNKGYNDYTVIGACEHKWYMREPGIQCIKCLIIWEKDE